MPSASALGMEVKLRAKVQRCRFGYRHTGGGRGLAVKCCHQQQPVVPNLTPLASKCSSSRYQTVIPHGQPTKTSIQVLLMPLAAWMRLSHLN